MKGENMRKLSSALIALYVFLAGMGSALADVPPFPPRDPATPRPAPSPGATALPWGYSRGNGTFPVLAVALILTAAAVVAYVIIHNRRKGKANDQRTGKDPQWTSTPPAR